MNLLYLLHSLRLGAKTMEVHGLSDRCATLEQEMWSERIQKDARLVVLGIEDWW